MPLSPAERDHIIEVEKLKDEVRRLLQVEPAQSGLSKFWQHPATLLILGFLLTGAAGAWLTHNWKESEWTNQQNYLFAQRSLDRKSAVIEATFKEVAATVAAADDLLATYYGGDWTKKDGEERWENWKKTSLAWRIQSKVLSARLAASFANKDVQSMFQQIMDQRKQLGNIIVNLPRRRPNDPTDEATLQEVKRASGIIKQISDLLNNCGSLMAKELPVTPASPRAGAMHGVINYESVSLAIAIASLLASGAATLIAKSSLSQAKQVAARDQEDWKQRKWFDLYSKADEAYDALDRFQVLYPNQSSPGWDTPEWEWETDDLMRIMRTVHRIAVVFPQNPEVQMLFDATAVFSDADEYISKDRLSKMLKAVEGIRLKARIRGNILD